MRLRLAELPAVFWVLLAGKQARRRLRYVLTARSAYEPEPEPAPDPGRAIAIGLALGLVTINEDREQRRIPESGPPATMPPLAAAFGGVSMAEAQAALTSFARLMREHCSAPLGSVADCGDGHEVLWVEGTGRVCGTCGTLPPRPSASAPVKEPGPPVVRWCICGTKFTGPKPDVMQSIRRHAESGDCPYKSRSIRHTHEPSAPCPPGCPGHPSARA